MTFPKVSPQAVWIKDRVCVFSSALTSDGNNFELYDPESNEWSTLPDPPVYFTKLRGWPDKRLVEMHHYYVDGNNLFVDTKVGSFLFQSEDFVWVQCEVDNRGQVYGKPRVWVKEGDFVFSPRGRIVGGKLRKDRERIPPHKNNDGFPMLVVDSGIGGLPKKKFEKLRLCVVKVGSFGLSELYEDVVLSLDLVTIDDQAKHTVLKWIMFNLDPGIHTRKIVICGIFPL